MMIPPVVFTTKTVEEQYSDLKEAGIVKEIDHAGNIRGKNDYAETRFAIQLGSSHHGAFEVRRRAAWLGGRRSGVRFREPGRSPPAE